MPPFNAMLIFIFTTTSIIVAGESMFRWEDPRIVAPIVQGVAFSAGFLVEWPLWVRHEPQRRTKSFLVYAASIIATMVLITAFRLAIGLAYIERIAIRFV
jgi:hypothetical protein